MLHSMLLFNLRRPPQNTSGHRAMAVALAFAGPGLGLGGEAWRPSRFSAPRRLRSRLPTVLRVTGDDVKNMPRNATETEIAETAETAPEPRIQSASSTSSVFQGICSTRAKALTQSSCKLSLADPDGIFNSHSYAMARNS